MSPVDDFQFPATKGMKGMRHADSIRSTVGKMCITQVFLMGPRM